MLFAFLIGLAFGFVLQRSQFCFYSGFLAIFNGRFKFILALLLAIIIQSVALFSLTPPLVLPNDEFSLATLVLGAVLFGVGMGLARMCASGAFFRLGEGSLGAFLVSIFFGLGFLAASKGALATLFKPLFKLAPLRGRADEILGISPWVLIFLTLLAFCIFLFFARAEFEAFKKPSLKHLRYKSISLLLGGALVGILGVLAWLDSFSVGRFFGLSISAGAGAILEGLVRGGFLGWASFMLAGLVLGSFASALLNKEFCPHAPQNAKEFIFKIIGGFLMGVGAFLAGGCNIANSLTSPAYFSFNGLIATPIIIISLYFTNKIIQRIANG